MKANCFCFTHIRNFHLLLDYAALHALTAVIREGNFERAARALHVTPSAISQRIRLLEVRVGCALVVRGPPCVATETGRRLCHQHVELPRHTRPSAHAFETALVGMGWGLHPQTMIAPLLASGQLVELVPEFPLDVPLYWQEARAASLLLDGLSRLVIAAARAKLQAV